MYLQDHPSITTLHVPRTGDTKTFPDGVNVHVPPDRMPLLHASFADGSAVAVKGIAAGYTGVATVPYSVSDRLPHCRLVDDHLRGVEDPAVRFFVPEL